MLIVAKKPPKNHQIVEAGDKSASRGRFPRSALRLYPRSRKVVVTLFAVSAYMNTAHNFTYVGVRRVAGTAGQSVRTVRENQARLVADGVLVYRYHEGLGRWGYGWSEEYRRELEEHWFWSFQDVVPGVRRVAPLAYLVPRIVRGMEAQVWKVSLESLAGLFGTSARTVSDHLKRAVSGGLLFVRKVDGWRPKVWFTRESPVFHNPDFEPAKSRKPKRRSGRDNVPLERHFMRKRELSNRYSSKKLWKTLASDALSEKYERRGLLKRFKVGYKKRKQARAIVAEVSAAKVAGDEHGIGWYHPRTRELALAVVELCQLYGHSPEDFRDLLVELKYPTGAALHDLFENSYAPDEEMDDYLDLIDSQLEREHKSPREEAVKRRKRNANPVNHSPRTDIQRRGPNPDSAGKAQAIRQKILGSAWARHDLEVSIR